MHNVNFGFHNDINEILTAQLMLSGQQQYDMVSENTLRRQDAVESKMVTFDRKLV